MCVCVCVVGHFTLWFVALWWKFIDTNRHEQLKHWHFHVSIWTMLRAPNETINCVKLCKYFDHMDCIWLPRLSFGSRWSWACNGGDGTTGISAAGNRIELFTKSSIVPGTALNNGFFTITRDVSLCTFLDDIFIWPLCVMPDNLFYPLMILTTVCLSVGSRSIQWTILSRKLIGKRFKLILIRGKITMHIYKNTQQYTKHNAQSNDIDVIFLCFPLLYLNSSVNIYT